MVDLDRMEDRRAEGDPLGVAKLTIQQFYLVDGESTQWRGVQPDVGLPDPASHVESGERYLENAIPWSQVPPLPATPWQHPTWDGKTLDAKSKTRQEAQAVFGKVRERGAYLLERRKETVVPLKRDAWQAQRKKDKEELEKLDPKLEDGPERFEVKLINYRPEEPVAPTPARKGSAVRVDKWKETLAHDPWVEESLFLLSDMSGVATGPSKAEPKVDSKPAAGMPAADPAKQQAKKK
jgi:carboxyl-terminal processing protease